MIPAIDNQAIIARCAAVGLRLDQARRLAGVGHSPNDLAYVLGATPDTYAPLRPRRWLWMAAQTCSVSYRKVLTPEALLEVLLTGKVQHNDASTIFHFLDEAPIQIVVMAIEQASRESDTDIAQIWRNLDHLATALSSTRLRGIAEIEPKMTLKP